MTITLEFKPTSAKALARFLYARIPGAARVRFAIKDLATRYVSKPEFDGVARLALGEGLIVDVGANRGQSVAAFRRLLPRCPVVAFEPEPRSADRLASRFGADRNVTIHICALGRRPGQLRFFVPRYGRWDCDGMAAMSRNEATEWLRDRGRMFRFDERKLTVEEYQVQCRTLDSFGLSPRLLKLHAQGAELDILNGATETLRRCRPALMCAFPTPELIEFLDTFDYSPHALEGGNFTPGVAGKGTTFTWFLPRSGLRANAKPLFLAATP